MDQVCVSAVERGLTGIAICNHADMGPCDVTGSYEEMCKCAEQVEQARRKYDIDILKEIISKDIALEINTSGIGTGLGDFMPHKDIVQMYAKAGGRLLTIGSDAHVPSGIGNGLESAMEMLRESGFDRYCYYTNREPQFIKL